MKEEPKELIHFAVVIDELIEKIEEVKKTIDIRLLNLEKENKEIRSAWQNAEEQWALWEQKAKKEAEDLTVLAKVQLLQELFERDIANLPHEITILFDRLYEDLTEEIRSGIVRTNDKVEIKDIQNSTESLEKESEKEDLLLLKKEISKNFTSFSHNVLKTIGEESEKTANYVEKSLIFNLRDIRDVFNKNVNKILAAEKEAIVTMNSKIDRTFDSFMSEISEYIEGTKNFWFMGIMIFLSLANLVMVIFLLLKK